MKSILVNFQFDDPIISQPRVLGVDDWACRKGASSDAAAINNVCPNAVLIADRFHLLMNLSDALDAYFKSIKRQMYGRASFE